MSIPSVKVLVLRVEGTNCDIETVEAFQMVNTETRLVHLNELLKGELDLDDYHVFCIPGGFSYGDDLGAGKLLANQLKYRLRRKIEKFLSEGRAIIGICNGFQALVKAGLLPAFEKPFLRQEATLALNEKGLFVDRWIYMKHEEKCRCVLTRNLNSKVLYVPVNHAEGRFVASKDTIELLEEEGYVVFRYVDPYGRVAGYPWNPNGSMNNIAGICNTDGNVLGLMPHPEKYVYYNLHPSWTRFHSNPELDGLLFFKTIISNIVRSLM
ncbi:phosphoribosylformylglycinamidine synthase I [Candidatus Bathyarchaeota archaeon]|nr:phosphoribosylformylglycinamidine synthase I [Candidatus Bathyarchaeota archaeon]MBS7612712.1 phosphoribosylformylglycinamidine synthase I [Candidatus Bathyarchaeota archaeon]MBS7617755.1 phosphoribosylformylglycinamidine synthase I [Candidatus Bathyarchaeota archaeon]